LRTILRFWPWLLAVLAVAGPARAHGLAVSRFVASVGDDELAVRVHLHLESMVTLIEGSPDSVHAGEGAPAARRHKQRILEYLHQHLVFGSERARCVPREPWNYEVAEGGFYVRIDLEYDCPKSTKKLSVTSTLFEEVPEPHHIEGEFHARGKRRLYLLSDVRSTVAIDTSSFHDRSGLRGVYVPPLDRSVATTEAATTTSGAADLRRTPESTASSADDRPPDSTRSKVRRRGVWYASGLALTFAMWQIHRVRRGRRSQRAGQDRKSEP